MKNNQNIKNKRKSLPIILAIGFAIALLVIVGGLVFYSVSSPRHKVQKQIELGQKYFMELDYENAVMAYEKAIEIDSKNVEVYLGLVNALIHLGKQTEDDVKALQYYHEALMYIEKGLEIVGDPILLLKKQEIEELINDIKDKEFKNENETEIDPISDEKGINSDSQAIIEKYEYADGSGFFEYEYDSEGNIIRNSSYYNDGTSSEVYYEISNKEVVKAERYENGQISGYTIIEYHNEKKSRFTEYDAEGSVIFSMDYLYDENENLIKYPTTYLDYHYGGWSEIVERYSDGKNKIVLQYDKDDNLIGTYCYDENGNMMMDEEGHPIVPDGWN